MRSSSFASTSKSVSLTSLLVAILHTKGALTIPTLYSQTSHRRKNRQSFSTYTLACSQVCYMLDYISRCHMWNVYIVVVKACFSAIDIFTHICRRSCVMNHDVSDNAFASNTSGTSSTCITQHNNFKNSQTLSSLHVQTPAPAPRA